MQNLHSTEPNTKTTNRWIGGVVMAKVYRQNDPDIPYEHCFKCGGLTGKAGRGDDSIYCVDENVDLGPFCEDCWHDHERECDRCYHDEGLQL